MRFRNSASSAVPDSLPSHSNRRLLPIIFEILKTAEEIAEVVDDPSATLGE